MDENHHPWKRDIVALALCEVDRCCTSSHEQYGLHLDLVHISHIKLNDLPIPPIK
jgi:hypothetical protein